MRGWQEGGAGRGPRERARLEEIARQRPAEQARLAKLEQQRVEYFERKLAQADERDGLRSFLMTLSAAHIRGEASHAFIDGPRQRVESMEAYLQLSTIAADVAEIEVFAVQDNASSLRE